MHAFFDSAKHTLSLLRGSISQTKIQVIGRIVELFQLVSAHIPAVEEKQNDDGHNNRNTTPISIIVRDRQLLQLQTKANHLHNSQDDGDRRVRCSNRLLASIGGIRRSTGRVRSTQQRSNGLDASAQVHSRSHPRNLCVTRNQPSRGRAKPSSSYEAHLFQFPLIEINNKNYLLGSICRKKNKKILYMTVADYSRRDIPIAINM